MIARDTSGKTILGKDERDATEGEIAALEAEHGPFLATDGEGWSLRQRAFRRHWCRVLHSMNALVDCEGG